MDKKKRPINGLIIISILAAFLLYRGYVLENPFLEEQIQVFGYMGQWPKRDKINGQPSSKAFGYIQPQVVDGFTEEPIEGAIVILPEINERFVTDENGYTDNIRAGVIVDSHFEDIHPKPWGEITLIVYKEGYREYVLLGLHLWEEENRQGPKIRLFPKVDGEAEEPMAIVEGPGQLWVNSLVERFRP